MKKSVIYCRVSTREQTEYGYSIRDQEEKLINDCSLVLGIQKEELLIYLEMGVSASTFKRKKLQEVLGLHKKKIKRIVIHNLDRMFRNMKDFLVVLEVLGKANVELVSLKEQIETQSAMGIFQVSLFVLMTEKETNETSQKYSNYLSNYDFHSPPS